MKKIFKIKNKSNETTVIIKNNYIINYLKNLQKQDRKIYCVIDSNLKSKFLKFNNSKNLYMHFLNGGENKKSIENYYYICEKILSIGIDRSSILVAIGGGTIGDLCGYIASTLLRGLEFKLIPTTLLSQVDSSIGGKNGINSKFGKNLIGTFYDPSEVIIDTSVLKKLPMREIKSGYAEILKHSIIKSSNFFNWLDINYKKILELNSSILEEAIFKSIMIKLWYVKKDHKEILINKNSRAMLNFGHSIGHSLETFYQYKNKLNHGEAVSIGMIVEAKISNKLGYLSKLHLDKIINHFKKAKLKIDDNNIQNKKILKILMNDKKNQNNKINMIMLKKIGDPFFARNIDLIKIKKILNEI